MFSRIKLYFFFHFVNPLYPDKRTPLGLSSSDLINLWTVNKVVLMKGFHFQETEQTTEETGRWTLKKEETQEE